MDCERYVLIEFTDENPVQIEAVPWFWVDEENSLCTYPPKSKWKFARNYIRYAKQPECSWPRYTCKIVKIFDNYDDAYLAMVRYQDNSDINSTDSAENNIVRNKKRTNQRVQSTSSEDRDLNFPPESTLLAPPQLDIDNVTTQSETMRHNPNFQNEVATYTDLTYSSVAYTAEYTPQVCFTSSAIPVSSYNEPSPPLSTSTNLPLHNPGNSENTICCFHKDIVDSQSTKLKNIEDKLQTIISILQNLQVNQFAPQPDVDIKLPLQEVEEFKVFEEDLKKVHICNAFEEICKKNMKSKCGPTVRSILKATITNKLATQVTLTGDKGRIAFKNSKILDIIRRLTQSRFKTVTIDAFNEEVFQWLRHSKARLKNEMSRITLQNTNPQSTD